MDIALQMLAGVLEPLIIPRAAPQSAPRPRHDAPELPPPAEPLRQAPALSCQAPAGSTHSPQTALKPSDVPLRWLPESRSGVLAPPEGMRSAAPSPERVLDSPQAPCESRSRFCVVRLHTPSPHTGQWLPVTAPPAQTTMSIARSCSVG